MREVKDITAMSVDERIAYAKANSPLTEEELQMIKEGSALTTDRADQMVENVIGVYSLPYSIAPGFVINGKEMIVPMVGEEPYVTKSTTSGARLAAANGGFTASTTGSFMIGQIQMLNIENPETARLK